MTKEQKVDRALELCTVKAIKLEINYAKLRKKKYYLDSDVIRCRLERYESAIKELWRKRNE